ncbi:MAG: hypothetical protein J3Q66DRAFT_408844 [Benniella sp.]|nr:MAG: hypothetical protein J3Q66DRAFT_408844 [Benniella sp.]
MLLQLLPDTTINDIVARFGAVDPVSVLSLVAKGTGRDLKIGKNGVSGSRRTSSPDDRSPRWSEPRLHLLQGFIKHWGFDTWKHLPIALLHINCDLADRSTKHWRLTTDTRVVLSVASLGTPSTTRLGSDVPVFEAEDIVQVLVDDCGGNGRALEILHEVLDDAGRNFNVEAVMNNLLHETTQALFGSYSRHISPNGTGHGTCDPDPHAPSWICERPAPRNKTSCLE